MELATLIDYEIAYYCIVVLSLAIGVLFKAFDTSRRSVLPYVIIIVLALLVGYRSQHIGTDTINYYQQFVSNEGKSLSYILKNANWGSDALFSILRIVLQPFRNYNYWFITISLIIFVVTYWAVRLYSGDKSNLMMFTYVIASSVFVNAQFNIIRQGIALSFVLLFWYFILQKKVKIWAALCALTAIGFHYSSIIPILIGLFVRFVNMGPKLYGFIYLSCIGLSFVEIGMHSVLPILGISHRAIDMYLISGLTKSYDIGFRLDFIVFNTFFLMVFKYLDSSNDFTRKLIEIYVLCSSVFFLWTYIPYSDRIGTFSWILIPIIFYLSIRDTHKRINHKYTLGFIFLMLTNMVLLFK